MRAPDALLLVAVACRGDGGPAIGGAPPGADRFAQDVQPVIARRCGFLGCHGREGLPLTLYAVDYLRLRDPDGELDPTRPPLRERELVPAELGHNRQALADYVDADSPSHTTLLRMLVSEDRGGYAHDGVVVFDRPDNPDYQALWRWVASVRPAAR